MGKGTTPRRGYLPGSIYCPEILVKYQDEKLRKGMDTHIHSGRSPWDISLLSVEIPRLNVLKVGTCDPIEIEVFANTMNAPEGPAQW